MSVVHVGAYAWNFVLTGGDEPGLDSLSFCDTTRVTDLSVFIADSSILLTKAVSGKHRQFCVCFHL
jgi:hypothetical protein